MEGLKELLTKMADDALIMGHRNSEWTGLGPTLEEDIAFSSMAQDKIGHAWNLFKMLHERMDLPDPDQMAFHRDEKEYKCCQLVELYTRDYATALVRQFFFDHAEFSRYELLQGSAIEPLAQFARKVRGEIKYHILHGDMWMKKLGQGNEESKSRIQHAVNESFPYALGIFEPSPLEEEIKNQRIFVGEDELRVKWLEAIQPVIEEAGLTLPDPDGVEPKMGGRQGYHTDHLKPLLDEMTEVFRTAPEAEW